MSDYLEVLWEREIDAESLGVNSWETIANRGFDNPRQFSAYLHTLNYARRIKFISRNGRNC
ncbi:hypothetical protein [Cyanothece sp. BG0011]|uniref:hypothetical protein n=1 Tax=Cyanothece sp. BG0011 TaxID=2082950 RepID=UPI000D1DD066|nr:hypothetical protein [Cyanothece sp. BG0011]